MGILRPVHSFRHPSRNPYFTLAAVALGFLFICGYKTFPNIHSNTTTITVNTVYEDTIKNLKGPLRAATPPIRLPDPDDLPAAADVPLKAGRPPKHLSFVAGKFRSNGLMEIKSFSPDQRHPIHDIISYSQAQWDRKVERASKTLGEAVAEYRRRYKRSPPRGFDKWCVPSNLLCRSTHPKLRWQYVQDHNVQLPDEYDQIYRDIQPFWGVSPEDMNRIEEEFEGHLESFTLGKGPHPLDSLFIPGTHSPDDGIVKVVNYTLREENRDHLLDGAIKVIETLVDIEHHLPPFRAPFLPHDNPDQVFDWELKQLLLKHAAAGTCEFLFGLRYSLLTNVR